MNSEVSVDTAPVDLGRMLARVHAQQSQIHGVLTTLDSRSREFDTTVGEAVQRALADSAGIRAAEKLSQIHRANGMRFARWSFAIVSACALVPTLLSWALLPSRAQVLQSRQALEQLNAGVAQLTRQGGRIDLRRCGAAQRLCVRIDRKSPFYGENADYIVLKGY
jgi:hypothetical protein